MKSAYFSQRGIESVRMDNTSAIRFYFVLKKYKAFLSPQLPGNVETCGSLPHFPVVVLF